MYCCVQLLSYSICRSMQTLTRGISTHPISPRNTQTWLRCNVKPNNRRLPVLPAKGSKKTTGNTALDNVLEVGANLVESGANLVPDSVPRGVAKGGVAVVGVLAVFWILQKLVSTALTIALLGGAAWFYFQYGGSSSSNGDSSKQSSSSSQDVDLNDPLAEARRIMDKYKN